MNKTARIVLALLVLAAAFSGAAILLRPAAPDHPVARIIQDGTLLREIDLEQVSAPYSFSVTDGEGRTNTVRVEPGRIRVESADCPDQVCVKQGFISDSAAPIVCLPHKLMIEITGGGESLDAAAG